MMDLDRSQKMSLTDAAQWYGVFVDKKKAHRALYDAEITAELVIPVLTGEYKRQAAIIKPSQRSLHKYRFHIRRCLWGWFSTVPCNVK